MARKAKSINQEDGKKKVNIGPKGTTTRSAQGNGKSNVKSVKSTPMKPVKQAGRAAKSPGGKGLGKAGAKRLGRLLKRAIQDNKPVTGNGNVPLPKTPVRLFKYQTQAEAANAPKTNAAKQGVARVPQLILHVVSQCKHRGGISMAELKQALAAGGYDVTKNNSRVNLVMKGLIRKETLLQTTGAGASGAFKLNKKLTEGKRVRTRAMKTSKPKGAGLKAGIPASKSPKPARKSPKQASKSPKPGSKSPKPAGKTPKPRSRAPKPAGKTPKPRSRAPKPAGKTPKPRSRAPKPAGTKPKPATKATKRVAQGGKAVGKAQRARGDGPKQNLHALKSPQKGQQPKGTKHPKILPSTVRTRTQHPRAAKTNAY